ncbi:MAG: group 1 truncated hemoglobin [Deltaproteobacteria bacterium]|nr:MAG: group 1 truncated hemoglobin [Deltaproteobacteria bacterium]
MKTHFELLGGEAALRRIIDTFVDRMFDDVMIGFFFKGVDRERLKAMEYAFTAAFLGAPVQYTGKPIGAAHARHPIMKGHFDRRLAILRETLIEAGVPDAVREAWLAHTEQLRPLVTHDRDCDHSPHDLSRSFQQKPEG